MNSESLFWWLSLLGSVTSIVGLPIAIWQIRKTRATAEAAETASKLTQRAISRNLLISEASQCIRYLEDVRSSLISDNIEFSLARLNDVIEYLPNLESTSKIAIQVTELDFREIQVELHEIRTVLSRALLEPKTKLKKVRMLSKLDIVRDCLNKINAQSKLVVGEGE